MKQLIGGTYTGERALFAASGLSITGGTFEDGESPLKHSRDIILEGSEFRWKYPLWYSNNIQVRDCTLTDTARAGIWYTNNVSVCNTVYDAPKGFRRCDVIELENVTFSNAAETLWQCRNVSLKNVKAKGDYLAMNCENVKVDNLKLDGNYSFDGGRNITVTNSRLLSKDAFWNCENIYVKNSCISGEYLGWNSKNLTFEDCTLESLQGLCFIEGLRLINCRLVNTTLSFEYSSFIDAEITGFVDSVKNPTSGVIRAGGIKELIMEPERVDVSKTEIIITGTEES
ncbi:MAG: DUF3737 family protein [Ruminococcus sp.]|nr:DUF3737 family protein [Ruminococcus sp.]